MADVSWKGWMLPETASVKPEVIGQVSGIAASFVAAGKQKHHKNMNQLAPIGICTYSRLDKLKLTIDALKRNTLATDSELHIFSDGPRKGDEEKVGKLRGYLETVDGFKKVVLNLPAENNQFQNTHMAHRNLTEMYGRSIFMEDDNITSPHFLEYMNKALAFYKDNRRVFSIGGYAPHGVFDKKASADVFFSRMFCPWGVGIWAESFQLFGDINWGEVFEREADNQRLIAELSYLGKHLSKRFKRWRDKGMKADQYHLAGDLLMTITMIKNRMFTVVPAKSLVKNIGLDESGLHSGVHDVRFDVPVDPNFVPKQFTAEAVASRRLCDEQYILNSYSKKQKSAIRFYYLLIREIKIRFSRSLGSSDAFLKSH
ncbi:MAG: hypothetical protein WAW39_05075 [Prosthecobacter sp.]|uniref:hypothetical protein n=1 Tax=Prosthecobacter sp. TaxID=1965333 RepID=UPI003BB02AD4